MEFIKSSDKIYTEINKENILNQLEQQIKLCEEQIENLNIRISSLKADKDKLNSLK